MSDLGTFLDADTVRFERLLPGPIEQVWEHLTNPELLAGWLAAAEIELRVGGRVELRFDVEEAPERQCAGSVVRGAVTRCEPPRALADPPGHPARARAQRARRAVRPRTWRSVHFHRRNPDGNVCGRVPVKRGNRLPTRAVQKTPARLGRPGRVSRHKCRDGSLQPARRAIMSREGFLHELSV